MSELLDRFNDACAERGINGLPAFAEHFGIAMGELDIQDALALAETPEWVLVSWLPNIGTTRVVWVPAAVRRFAAAYGIVQDNSECDHDFTVRVRKAFTERLRGRAANPQ